MFQVEKASEFIVQIQEPSLGSRNAPARKRQLGQKEEKKVIRNKNFKKHRCTEDCPDLSPRDSHSVDSIQDLRNELEQEIREVE